MDNFRVFEPIIGFSAEGSAQSLSWLIYDNLVNEEVILFGSAAATSMMTIIGIAILLAPVLIRTWKEFKTCLLYTSPSPRDGLLSRMPSSA